MKILTALLCVILLSLLCLNLFTLWSVGKIKSGEPVRTGHFCAIIGSGSMEPTLSVNDFLIIKAGVSYVPGDIVTYVTQRGALVTHEIKEVTPNGYITKGKANNIPDEEISRQRVLGKTVFALPKAGGVIGTLNSNVGMVLMIFGFTMVWIIWKLKGGKGEKTEERVFEDISSHSK